MCFLPLKCLKVIVFVGAVFSILISLAILVSTIYVNVAKKDIINAASQGNATGFLVLLYVTSIIFLLLGIAGLSGSMKSISKKSSAGCLLGLYSIGVFIFFLVFLGSAIFFFVGPQLLFGKDCTTGSKLTLIDNLYNVSVQVDAYFCKDSCACNAQGYLAAVMGANYNIKSTGVKSFQECNPPANITDKFSQDTLYILETALNCGGWCNTEPVYFRRFTDINSCNSADCIGALPHCYDQFKSSLENSGLTVGLGCVAGTLLCFLNIMAACCICYHPTKRGKNDNFYQRMISTD